jgi:TrmH family RNA methyltransferase
MLITSTSNPKIKLVKKLKEEKFRAQEKTYFIEGFTLVEDALNEFTKDEFLFLLFSSAVVSSSKFKLILNKVENLKISAYEVLPTIFKIISDIETPGVLGVVKQKSFSLEQFFNKKDSLYLLLDRVQDPGNLGTIVRTSEACGVKAIFLNKGTVDPYNPKAVRAAMGSTFRMPLIRADDFEKLIFTLKAKKVKIFASSSHQGVSYYGLDYKFPLALIVGNEAEGISREILKSIDNFICIPINNKVESLNVSVATAVILFEMIKCREEK